ncbi:hypothetical protein B0H14DRAFT_2712603 [Mycena olivaceomarginata]|nr:hypothetical protein B0H14DRAFT_2712603 [Mycena olivaceomarginata]
MLGVKTLVRQLQRTPNESDCRGSLTVGRLRYHASPSISNLAKETVKDWKAVVEEERAEEESGAAPRSPRRNKLPNREGGEMRSSTVYSGLTGDKTRNSCIEMISRAAVHKEYRGGNGLYLKATQTLFSLPPGQRQFRLREAVSSGDLPVERFLKIVGHGCAVES